MKSKFTLKGVLGGLLLMFGFLFSAVNAQAQTVTSADYYFGSRINYMMGTVSLPASAPAGNLHGSVGTNTLATSTISVCVPLLSEFHKFGDVGEDVAKLQAFLNQMNGASLNKLGYYGPATVQEVKNLQFAYGIKPTGSQYEKTTDLVNKINCGQIQKKDRVVFTNSISRYSGGDATFTTNLPKDLYPNAPVSASLNKIIEEKAMLNSGTSKVKDMSTKTQDISTTSSTTSFWDKFNFWNIFGSDLEKVKQNYKAYLLVFILVLALFWFLRKAATE